MKLAWVVENAKLVTSCAPPSEELNFNGSFGRYHIFVGIISCDSTVMGRRVLLSSVFCSGVPSAVSRSSEGAVAGVGARKRARHLQHETGGNTLVQCTIL